MKRLLAIAAEAGYRVVVATITPGIKGFIDTATHVIYLSRRLTPVELLCTLANELGHAFHGHDCDTPRGEDQANAYACRILIDADRYAAAERLSPYAEDIADELGVTVDVVRHYQQYALQRLGARTWARPPLAKIA